MSIGMADSREGHLEGRCTKSLWGRRFDLILCRRLQLSGVRPLAGVFPVELHIQGTDSSQGFPDPLGHIVLRAALHVVHNVGFGHD